MYSREFLSLISGFYILSIAQSNYSKMTFSKHFNDHPFPYHHELELDIATLTNLGIGLGRIDGWVIMVPFALPGERIRARVYRNHKNYSEADLIEILRASPKRVQPSCPLFGLCGGCQYQNLEYAEQLQWKQNQVQEAFERIGSIFFPVNPTHPSPKQYGYRSKLTPHYSGSPQSSELQIGFLKCSNRSQLVDVPSCPIAMDGINQRLRIERAHLKSSYPSDRHKRGGTIFLRETEEGVTTDPKAQISEKVGALHFEFCAGDFFQNNPFILSEFVDYVITQSRGTDGQNDKIQYLIDAYCGSGLFCLSASHLFKTCIGIEISESAIHWARNNAKLNHIQNCEFRVGSAENIFKEVHYKPEQTSVIIDPPRKGCDDSFIHQLLSFGPTRIVYVSCAPDTQARDLKSFIASNYKITAIQPFDLFPQTRHIENVVTMSL